MGLRLDAASLSEEVARAEEFRRLHTAKTALIVKRFFGNWYRTDAQGDPTPENLVFSYIAYMLPEVAFTNPQFRVTPRRPVSDKQLGEWMQMALNEWTEAHDLVEGVQDCCRDFFMAYGFSMVGIAPRDFHGPAAAIDSDPGLQPFHARLDPNTLILDPVCDNALHARYVGHVYYRDLEDLQADPDTWPPDKVAQLSGAGLEDRDEHRQGARTGQTPDRMRVKLVDLWIPEHNVIVTLASDASDRTAGGASVLRMQEYWGPPEGPYEVWGAYTVANDPYPLGVLTVVMDAMEELWAHQVQASDEAINYKRITLVESTAKDAQKAVLEGTSGGVYGVAGLTGKVMQLDLGGSPPGRQEQINLVRERADRTIGLSDAQRGRITNSTATEADVVQGNVDTRTSYLKARVRRHVGRIGKRIGWYLYYEPLCSMPVSHTDPMTGVCTEGTFYGGVQRGQEGIDWIDFRLTIEPESMTHTDDAAKLQQAMATLDVMDRIAAGLINAPYMNWAYAADQFGEAMNRQKLSQVLINQQALMQFGQQQQNFAAEDDGSGMPPPAGPGGAGDYGAGGGFGGGGNMMAGTMSSLGGGLLPPGNDAGPMGAAGPFGGGLPPGGQGFMGGGGGGFAPAPAAGPMAGGGFTPPGNRSRFVRSMPAGGGSGGQPMSSQGGGSRATKKAAARKQASASLRPQVIQPGPRTPKKKPTAAGSPS